MEPELDINGAEAGGDIVARYRVRWHDLRTGTTEIGPRDPVDLVKDLIIDAADLDEVINDEDRQRMVLLLVDGRQTRNLISSNDQPLTAADSDVIMKETAFLYLSTPEEQGNVPYNAIQEPEITQGDLNISVK